MDVSPLKRILFEFQMDRPKEMTQRLKAAQQLVDEARQEHLPEADGMICIVHELLLGQHYTDDVGYAESILKELDRHQEQVQPGSNCVTCFENSRGDALIALGRYHEALSLWNERLKILQNEKASFGVRNKISHTAWNMLRIRALQGEGAAARNLEALVQKMCTTLIAISKGALKQGLDDPDWVRICESTIKNSEESIREARVMALIAKRKHSDVCDEIRSFLSEIGDGDTGFATIMHAALVRMNADQAWAHLIDLGPTLEQEFETRGHRRWLAQTILYSARAHLAQGDRVEARLQAFKLEDFQDELLGDNMEADIQALRDELSA